MAGVNKVILVGRLGKDPESKTFANGGTVVQFTMATSENWRDKATGERKERPSGTTSSFATRISAGLPRNICARAAKSMSKARSPRANGRIRTALTGTPLKSLSVRSRVS